MPFFFLRRIQVGAITSLQLTIWHQCKSRICWQMLRRLKELLRAHQSCLHMEGVHQYTVMVQGPLQAHLQVIWGAQHQMKLWTWVVVMQTGGIWLPTLLTFRRCVISLREGKILACILKEIDWIQTFLTSVISKSFVVVHMWFVCLW